MSIKVNSGASALTQLSRRLSNATRSRQPSASGGVTTTGRTEDGTEDRLHALRLRIATLAPEEPGRNELALRWLVEDLLSQEFGPAVALDPDFSQTVQAVIDAIDDDPQIRRLAVDAVSELR